MTGFFKPQTVTYQQHKHEKVIQTRNDAISTTSGDGLVRRQP